MKLPIINLAKKMVRNYGFINFCKRNYRNSPQFHAYWSYMDDDVRAEFNNKDNKDEDLEELLVETIADVKKIKGGRNKAGWTGPRIRRQRCAYVGSKRQGAIKGQEVRIRGRGRPFKNAGEEERIEEEQQDEQIRQGENEEKQQQDDQIRQGEPQQPLQPIHEELQNDNEQEEENIGPIREQQQEDEPIEQEEVEHEHYEEVQVQREMSMEMEEEQPAEDAQIVYEHEKEGEEQMEVEAREKYPLDKCQRRLKSSLRHGLMEKAKKWMGRIDGTDIGQVINEMDVENVAILMEMASKDIGICKGRLEFWLPWIEQAVWEWGSELDKFIFGFKDLMQMDALPKSLKKELRKMLARQLKIEAAKLAEEEENSDDENEDQYAEDTMDKFHKSS